MNDHEACSILLPVTARRCVCPGEGCGYSLIHSHPSCSDSNDYRQVADSATKADYMVEAVLLNTAGCSLQPSLHQCSVQCIVSASCSQAALGSSVFPPDLRQRRSPLLLTCLARSIQLLVNRQARCAAVMLYSSRWWFRLCCWLRDLHLGIQRNNCPVFE